MRFWGLHKIPDELIAFILNNNSINCDIFADYEIELRFLSVLQSVKAASTDRAKWELVMTSGELDIVKYMHLHGYPWCPEALCTAAAQGHAHLLKYSLENGCVLSGTTHDQICTAAIENKHQDCLEHTFQQQFLTKRPELSFVAARANNLDALMFLHKNGCSWSAATCVAAVRTGSLACLRYLHDNSCAWDANVVYTAIDREYQECLQNLLNNQCPVDSTCLNAFVARGDYENAKLSLERGVQVHNYDELDEDSYLGEQWATTEAAAHGGNVQCLELVVQHGAQITQYVCILAVEKNSVACLKFAHEHGCPIDAECVFRRAVQRGHQECIQYLAEHQLACSVHMFEEAVSSPLCKLETVALLHQHGYPWNARVSHAAIKSGKNMECVDYLLSHGCPADASAVNALAQLGDLARLQLLFDRATPVDHQTASQAARSGNLQCLQLVIHHGATWNASVCVNAVEKNDIASLTLAHESGCPWKADVLCVTAARHGSLDCFKYLVEQGCSMNCDVTAAAAGNGHLECLKYAHEHGCPWDSETCARAARNLHYECLFYAHAEGCPLNPVDVKPSGPV